MPQLPCHDVVHDREVGDEVELLVHEPDERREFATRFKGIQVFPIDLHRPDIRADHPAEKVEERRLPTTAGAKHRYPLPMSDADRHVSQGDGFAVRPRDSVEGEHRVGLWSITECHRHYRTIPMARAMSAVTS